MLKIKKRKKLTIKKRLIKKRKKRKLTQEEINEFSRLKRLTLGKFTCKWAGSCWEPVYDENKDYCYYHEKKKRKLTK